MITIYQGQRVRINTKDGRAVHGGRVPCGAMGTVEYIIRGSKDFSTEYEYNPDIPDWISVVVVMDDKVENPVKGTSVSSNNAIIVRPENLQFLEEPKPAPTEPKQSYSMQELMEQEVDMIATQIFIKNVGVGNDATGLAEWALLSARTYIEVRNKERQERFLNSGQ